MRPAKFDGGASPLEFLMFEKGAVETRPEFSCNAPVRPIGVREQHAG
jgi:hypothetical protein